MPTRPLLEIAVESIAAAQAAERAGVDRIELCVDLQTGGLTPSGEFMRAARAALRIPIHALIRLRPGDFVCSAEEIIEMSTSITQAREAGMNGIVVGVLNANATIDVRSTKELIDLASPLEATFHRAFDECQDLLQALEDVVLTGASRILTSGGAPNVSTGLPQLKSLVSAADQRIIIMPGGGIRPDNFIEIRQFTGAKEFHSGLGTVLPYGTTDISQFENQVRELVRDLNR
jgi:copper homeostasis protein